MPWSVIFRATGKNFLPSTIDYPFSKSCDPGTLDPETPRYRSEPRPYGLVEIEVPSNVPNGDRIIYVARVALAILPEIKRAGATEWEVNIGRFYTAQCNEAYSSEELALLAQLDCPLLYSAYEVSEEEEVELTKELGGYE